MLELFQIAIYVYLIIGCLLAIVGLATFRSKSTKESVVEVTIAILFTVLWLWGFSFSRENTSLARMSGGIVALKLHSSPISVFRRSANRRMNTVFI